MANERAISKFRGAIGPDADGLEAGYFISEINTECSWDDEYFDVIDDSVVQYIYLLHYDTVEQVIIQNLDDAHELQYSYTDEVTTNVVTETLLPGQFVAFCRPVAANGVALVCADVGEDVSAHVTVIGRRDL